ncbi:Sorting nexin mvp1 [Daldinia eschscholtzii]|uniref:Sorting nexin MVP1 n=1 Tax=Daldinia eschscholtzii TaxID=292717 RepID=A0AAX6MC56_9PEZI
MSLFGTSPPNEAPSSGNPSMARSSLFDDDGPMTRSTSDTLFNDDDFAGSGRASPWDMPTPRKQQSRADLLRRLLDGVDVPDSYIEAFDRAVQEDGSAGNVTSSGVTKTLAAAKLGADDQAQIMGILAPAGDLDPIGRNEFNVLMALIGLAQEGESISLDGVDERRRNLPQVQLSSAPAKKPIFPDTAELAAKPPQQPENLPTPFGPQSRGRKPSMDGPEDDPWNSSDVHRHHNHGESPKTNGTNHANLLNGNGYGHSDTPDMHARTTSNFTTSTMASAGGAVPQSAGGSVASNSGGWGYFDGNNAEGLGEASSHHPANPFGGPGDREGRDTGANPTTSHSRTISGGRSGIAVEENITVSLMPEKEGVFLFQHHNYEVTSSRRGSKVIRRYSDFVWLLDCLHKRYPFRALPLLPPKRVAVNGNHLSNDGAFIEKRRRGLARFLNTLVRHPVLGQEQLVIMFLTVPTELAVWRKQAAISVVDEFTGRPLPPGLEESLPSSLEELFERTRQGVKRSAELYISTCNIMDRLVKRSEGVAADHGRLAVSLTSLTEASSDTYATDTNDVPLLNDGLVAMSRHLQTTQSLMEDESKAWDAGVLEDLKKQRDALVSVRELFDRRERLDKDNIPYLERRIQNNETKLAGLRAKPEVKPGEIEKVVEAIIKDKESIVNQHNRSIFVKECLRDELIYFQQTQFHVSRWNQDWAQERVKYSEMLADNWRRLLDELEGMPLGD